MKRIRKVRKFRLRKFIGVVFVVFIIIILIFLFGKNYFISDKAIDTKKNSISDKSYSFIKFGTTIDETVIYLKDQDKYKDVGVISEGINLEFSKLVDNYLLINGFDNEFYVEIEDIKEIFELQEHDSRYKEYILFNENIITNDITNFYDDKGNLVYRISLSYDLPVIIKDKNRYGIEYNNQLLYVNDVDVKEVKQSINTDKKNSSGVGVLNYHFFYDENNESEKKACNQVICESKGQFQKDLDYLKENNILTITTKELELYIDGKINLPKSVLITIDDGYMIDHALELLEKNEMYGCVFLITSWFDNIDFKNDYNFIEFHSHGEKLHDVGVCSGGQGGAIKCLEKEKLLADLKKSSQKLGGSTIIAYPFYEYNDYSIRVLNEAGYTMAFAGENVSGDHLVHVGSNKYELPRFVMVNYTSKKDLDNYFKKIK